MNNYIIKICPGHMPCIEECEELTLEYMQTCVEGPIEVTVLNRELRNIYPKLRMIVNEEGMFFNLPFNGVATLLHDVLRGQILGTAILVFADGEELLPLNDVAAAEFRETLEEIYDIEFEEVSECE